MTAQAEIGQRRCRDCRKTLPKSRMWRCQRCLEQRIEQELIRAREAYTE